jgi:hypothetical protein
MNLVEIGSYSVNQEDYKDLVTGLLQSAVYGTNSPFNDMMDKFEQYLDRATDLDTTQKQAAYADMLKETYSQINSQSMQQAMDLLKGNEELQLQRWDVEAGYNKTLADIAVSTEQQALTAAQALGQVKDNLLKDEQITESRFNQAKAKVELEKQWGKLVDLGSTTVTTVDDGLGTVTTTTEYDNTVITDSPTASVVDKQIRGYDIVNYKDVLKTLDERVALMQNAKVPETSEEKELRAELIKKILEGEVITTANVRWSDEGVAKVTDGIFGN